MATSRWLAPLPGRRKFLPTPHLETLIRKSSPHNKPPFIDDSLPKDLVGYRRITHRPSVGGGPPSNPPPQSSQAIVTAEEWPEMAWMYWTVDHKQLRVIVKPSNSPPVRGWLGWRRWYESETKWSTDFFLYTADSNSRGGIRLEPQNVAMPSIGLSRPLCPT